MARGPLLPLDWLFMVGAGESRNGRAIVPSKSSVNEIRHQLLEALDKDPGANLTCVARRASIGRSSAAHHLYALERAGLIRSVAEGRERHYFLGRLDPKTRGLILVVRKGHAARVGRTIKEQPGLIQKDLTDRLGISRKVIGGSLRRLVDAGLVRVERSSRSVAYYPTPDLSRVLDLLAGAEGRGRDS